MQTVYIMLVINGERLNINTDTNSCHLFTNYRSAQKQAKKGFKIKMVYYNHMKNNTVNIFQLQIRWNKKINFSFVS